MMDLFSYKKFLICIFVKLFILYTHKNCKQLLMFLLLLNRLGTRRYRDIGQVIKTYKYST